MAKVRCPTCGKNNSPELEVCQFCGARIKPILASTPVDSKPIKAGEDPTIRETSEFDKVKPATDEPIHPGEIPTKKDTSELEQALPSWLRSLRSGEDSTGGESEAEAAPGGNPFAAPDSSAESPDWLSGLGKAASDESEEVPDWLAGLRGGKPGEPASVLEPGSSKQMASPGDDVSQAAQEPPAVAQNEEDFPDWLSGLPGTSGENEAGSTATGEVAPADSTPDWLNRLKDEIAKPEPASPGELVKAAPDWLSSFGPEPGTPTSATGESVPAWLSNLELKSSTGPGKPAALFDSDSKPADTPTGEVPDWLSKMQADVNSAAEIEKHKDDFEVASEPPASQQGTGTTPEWMTGIDDNKPASSGTPALIGENKDNLSGETAFSMETPDWLSKLKPEQGAEKSIENREEQSASEDIKTTELPSWVQAMRPVESIVSDATNNVQENAQVTEQSGPLAGLRGVLPSGPGLGTLRKPPAYSVKLQVSDGQQRYAAFLEQLVSGETHPREVGAAHLKSNQLWRWITALLLFLAVGLPLATSTQLTPANPLLSSDKGSSKILIDGIPTNAPVLIAFDYEPALSGELEAVAAPLIDQLLAKEIRLALISTSPTGPALAEHFLEFTPLINSYQYGSGEQYVNLGYLAGGPAGILYFATNPQEAAPVDTNGSSAWDMPPLQGIQALSDFATIIILTDNGDTGRNWVEQAGPRMGDTPMMMIISAQAEPMIRPYFDSGQIKGLVSGLADAKIYEQNYIRPGLAHAYWDAYSIGLLVVEILIGVGAIWSIVAGLRTRHNNPGEKA